MTDYRSDVYDDYMPGMGAQGFNLMGGVSLVF